MDGVDWPWGLQCCVAFTHFVFTGPLDPKPWILPPLSDSWIIVIIQLYIAVNRSPNIDCYWVGAVPN